MAHCNPLLFYKNLHFQSRGWGKNKSITYLQAFDGNSIQLKTNATWLLFQAQPQKSVKTLTAIYTLFIHCTVIYPLSSTVCLATSYKYQFLVSSARDLKKRKAGTHKRSLSKLSYTDFFPNFLLSWQFCCIHLGITATLGSTYTNYYGRGQGFVPFSYSSWS